MKTITAVMWDPGDSLNDKSLDEKITLIEAKFKQAYQLAMSEDSGDNDNTFVFLCPEFALLNMDAPEKNNSYSKQEFQQAGERLKKLVDDFPNAILVPGTTYLEKTLDLADAQKKVKYADTIKKWQLRNLKPLRDFQQEIEGMTLVKNTSTAFFHSGDATNKPKRYSKRTEANELLEPLGMFYPGHGEPFFTKNGIRFGIEICADHKAGVLESEQRKAGQNVDVHLIVANTIYTIPSKVAKDTAIVLNCAGSFRSDNHAAKATGVWVRDADGTLQAVELSPCSIDDLRIYADIPLLNLKEEHSFRSR